MTSLHWQTSLQTQKGHALTQFTLVNERDHDGLEMTSFVCYSSRRPYMVHRPTRVGTDGSSIAFDWSSPGVFL